MKLCSACLLGLKCRYDGTIKPNKKVIELAKKEVLIPVCPEQMAGQTTPRPDAEISGGDGSDVLKGAAKVIEPNGKDITEFFVKGAEEVLTVANLLGIKEAIMKQRSPSCGCGKTYNGTFTDTLISGDGVTTAMLKKNGIKVISDEDLS